MALEMIKIKNGKGDDQNFGDTFNGVVGSVDDTINLG